MSFIRIKKIKDKEYAYLVKNKWTKKGPRQKGSKYLGPVTKIADVQSQENQDFYGYIQEKYTVDLEEFFESKNPRELLNEIIFFELKKFGFKEYFGKKGTKKNSMILENCVVDLNNLKVNDVNDEKAMVLYINSDFLCEYTLKKIYNFLEFGRELDIAKKLAKTFISCGIPIEDEIFVLLFKKAFKDGRLKFI